MAEQKTEQAAIGYKEMLDMANRYMVPMSEDTVKQLAGEDASSKASAFEEYLKTTAQGLYPAFANQIKSGIPTAFLLEPYRQVAKKMLGEGFEPDFMNDHNSSAVLQGGIDPASGRAVPMTLDQWKDHIRSTPAFGWQYTDEAHARVNTILGTLQDGLGMK